MDEKYSVYVHITPNNKRYVGITCRLVKNRWGKNGINYRNQVFGHAIKKYGWDNIEHIVLEIDLNREDAELKEIEYIALWKTHDNDFGYNLTFGGGLSAKHTDEHNRKISEGNKGKVMSEESRLKMSISAKGKIITEETKKNMSIAGKGRIFSEEHCKKIGLSQRGELNNRSFSVIQFSEDMEYIQIFGSLREVERQFGYSHGNISSCCKGLLKSAYGYKWKYESDYIKENEVVE
jgi:group I intron endonuclease